MSGSSALDARVFCETSLMLFWVAMVFIGCWRISLWVYLKMSYAGSGIQQVFTDIGILDEDFRDYFVAVNSRRKGV